MPNDSEDKYIVTGCVWSAESAGVGGLIVRLVDKNIGADVELAETTTDSSGHYHISFSLSPASLRQRLKTQPDLQVRVFAGDTFLAASEVRYNASASETLDVTLPAGLTALPSEHETLTAHLGAIYDGKLADLQETDVQQDITYLANKTGWDARAVALAALAEQFSQFAAPGPFTADEARTPAAVKLKPEFYYALFRAGIPANPDSIFAASPKTVQAVWEQAIQQGVIPQSLTREIPKALKGFQELSTAHTLDAKPPVGISTLKEMLYASLLEPEQQQQFAKTYVQHRDDLPEFWEALEGRLGKEQTKQLQFNGRLFYLTLNNAPLVQALHEAEKANPMTSTLDLATRGYHESAKWLPLIGTLAIPSQIPGESTEERRANYAEMMAAKVRLSHPTAVVADFVRRGKFTLSRPKPSDEPVESKAPVKPDHVADFLITHESQFAIGAEPIEAYVARHKITDVAPPVVHEIKRLQRVYQMTPDDHTMAALLRHDLDSAYAIVRYDAAGFAREFQDQLGGHENAQKIHARAKQIHGAVLNIAISYLNARVAPTLGGRSPVHVPFTSPAANSSYPVVAYPTLESLFGSLDYCNCRECRSILSPAAYLVDLLNFIDKPSPSPGYQNPLDVLLKRRPNLQYLALSCENTNTTMPYIDIVNETLEHFVANYRLENPDSLFTAMDNFQGHDTDASVTSKELMAAPQFVNDSAYDALRNAYFPSPLPFNRPLELLRIYFGKLGLSLPDVMAKLRVNDSFERPGSLPSSPASYGWRDILMEELSISREEYRLFTDSKRVTLEMLYGGLTLSVLQDLSLEAFSRRTQVSYDDLVAIVKTRFVNPNAVLIPRLEKLKASFADLQHFTDVPDDLDATKYGGSSPTDKPAVVKWVMETNHARIMGIITITDPSGETERCDGSLLRFRYSNPDVNANKLSETDFVKLIRFIRLWRKLGLSITQTDEILAGLYPADKLPIGTNDAANLALLDAGFLIFLPRVGFLFQIMRQLALKVDTYLAPLLACWAPIGTAGDNSLYRKMFLSHIVEDLGPQTATIEGPITPGDVLRTLINGVPIPTKEGYLVQAGDTIALVASNLAKAINASIEIDPESNLPIKSRFLATSQAGVITIKAGFTLKCESSGTVQYDLTTQSPICLAPSPVCQTAKIAGPITIGDELVTTINGLKIGYTVVAGDKTPTDIANHIVLAINETVTPDPYSGLPLNNLVIALSEAEVITFQTVNAGAPFDLDCLLLMLPATGTYTHDKTTSPESWKAMIDYGPPFSTVEMFVDLITKFNDVTCSSVTGAIGGSTPVRKGEHLHDLIDNIKNDIKNNTNLDPITGQQINKLVQAEGEVVTPQRGVVTITALDLATRFKIKCIPPINEPAELTVDYTASGPFLTPQKAVVEGTFREGSLLFTTIDHVTIPYTVALGDTATTIAANIAKAINDSTAFDPDAGERLSDIVTASADQGTITVTAKKDIPFVMACSLLPAPAATYKAGRQLSPFAIDGYGDFLQDSTQRLFGHEPILRAAFNLTGAEFSQITNALKFTAGSPLNLDNISAIFRMGWLAHTLRLSVEEFLRLRQVTVLDPFVPLDPGATNTALEPPIIRFIRLLQALSASGLQPTQALYLMWNEDISGNSTPPISDVTGFARTLRAAFAAVEAQFALKDDPDGSIAKSLMSLVYDNDATDFFFGLLNGTLATSVDYANPEPTLPQPIVEASKDPKNADSKARLSYDDLRKQLIFLGVLDSETQSAIDKAITAQGPLESLSNAFKKLAEINKKTVQLFFDAQKELLPLYTAYAASSDPPPLKRTALLAGILPDLKRKRMEAQALDSITAAIGTGPSFATALLQDQTILRAAADGPAPAVTDLTAMQSQGLFARFFLNRTPPNDPKPAVAIPLGFLSATLGGTVKPKDILTTTINGIKISYEVTDTDTSLETLAKNIAAKINDCTVYDPLTQLPLNQIVSAFSDGKVLFIAGIDPVSSKTLFSILSSAGTYSAGSTTPISVSWSGYVDAPQDGFYDISVETSVNAKVVLQLGNTQVSMKQAGNTWSYQKPIPLKAGTLTSVALGAISCMGSLSVTWQSQGLGRTVIPSQSLYSMLLVDRYLHTTYVRFLKATSLARALSFTANELAYLGKAILPKGPIWLSILHVDDKPNPGVAAILREVLTALLDFAQLKQSLSPKDERLLGVLKTPTLPDGSPSIRVLTGWSIESINLLMQRFFGNFRTFNLTTVGNLKRVYDAFSVLTTSRISVPTLIAAITNAPSAPTVAALQGALRAHYAETDWLTLIQPISDAMRIQQRDALVAYILQQFGDHYESKLFQHVTTTDAPAGTNELRLDSLDGLSLDDIGIGIRGPNLPVYAKIVKFSPVTHSLFIHPATLGKVLKGSIITFVPNDAVEINTSEKLFEYFLIDIETQPAVETSRIRLALSSVQLFIERVLRNLEPQCNPADVENPSQPSQWAWMKRYRVWQANREVFLWPENWLYPELRDDQSPFFQEMMSSLLQSDITDDAAATAYLDYLTKLEAVAKLEPCGLYQDTDGTSYVAARTAGANRKHYFRKLQNSSWSPWTEVKIDCEDMPLTPIVWNGRLFLFWLKVLKQVEPQQPDLPPPPALPTGETNNLPQTNQTLANANFQQLQAYAKASNDKQKDSVTVQAVLCWSEFYNGKWQPTKTSDINRPTSLGEFPLADIDTNRNLWNISSLKIDRETDDELALFIYVFNGKNKFPVEEINSQGFLLHNTHSNPVRFEDAPYKKLAHKDDISELYPVEAYTGGNPTQGDFGIKYYKGDSPTPAHEDSNILGLNRVARYVISDYYQLVKDTQPGKDWLTPFFFEDRRYVFYVTTQNATPTITLFNAFGYLSTNSHVQGTDLKLLPLLVPKPTKQESRKQESSRPFIRDGHGPIQTVTYQSRRIDQDGSIVFQIINRSKSS